MRVFVLSTGRCGTTTFTYACKHMTNFTVGHETRARYIGSERLDYPDNHIEIDNRLSWFLGRLDRTYGNEAYFVHLVRDKTEVAESYARRMSNPLSIGAGHKNSILMDAPYDDLDVCLDVTETMLANIEHFLRDKEHVMHMSLGSIEADFSRFWDWIRAEGDQEAALAEWKIRYNDSRTKHGQIQRPSRPGTELAELREKCRNLGEKNRSLRATATKEAAKFEYADKLYREAAEKLLNAEREQAKTEARYQRIELLGKQEAARLRQDLEDRDRSIAALRSDVRGMEKQLGETEETVKRHTNERDAFVQYASELEDRFQGVLRSRSWKIMGPYRFVMRKLKSLIRGHPIPPNSLPLRPALEILPDDKQRRKEGSGRASPVRSLDDKLWGGFSRSAYPELVAVKNDSRKPADVRSDAAYRLARWHSVHGDYENALEEIRVMRTIYPECTKESRQFIPEALFLCRLGRVEEARSLLEAAEAGFNSTIQLMLANTWNPAVTGAKSSEAEAKVLAYLNAIYERFGLSHVEKRDPKGPLSIDNICGTRPVSAHPDPRQKVTVIMPVFNAQDTITTALSSVADQTWPNLEVLVVDDASTDSSADVISEFCASDERFRLVRRKDNSGSYVCRNYALQFATGDYVTVHDSDDWSHPDKIRCQVESLRDNPVPYNLTMWVRTTSELAFFGNSRTLHNLVRPDHSSGFYPTESFSRYGAWDAVRISADTELFWRIESVLGNKKWMLNRRQILDDCPLAFGRMSDTSLTQAASTQVMTIYHGVRREYRDAADCWHADLKTIEDTEPSARRQSFFPVPALITPDAPPADALGALLIADWNSPEMAEIGRDMLQKAGRLGTIGLFQYPRYESKVTVPLNQQLRRFAWDNAIRVVAPGEAANVNNVIVVTPGVFEHALDRFPAIEYKRLLVVDGESAESSDQIELRPYATDLVRQHLVELLADDGEWVSTIDAALESMASSRSPQSREKAAAPEARVEAE